MKNSQIKTSKEFNEKYKDFLIEGAYGLDIDDIYIVQYLDKQFQDLILIPNFKYSQIKLKFGTCRFYTGMPIMKSMNEYKQIVETYITDYFKSKSVQKYVNKKKNIPRIDKISETLSDLHVRI